MTTSKHAKQMEYNATYRAKKRIVKGAPKRAAKRSRAPIDLAALEADPAAWLKHFLADAFPLPWGQFHHDIIAGVMYSVETGGRGAVAGPRGEGKSTLYAGVTLYLVMTKRIRFPAYLPWKAKDKKKALRFWKNALCFNAELARHYREFCYPFVACRGNGARLAVLTNDDGDLTGAQLQLTDGMIVFPDSLGVIGSDTLNGNQRGLSHATPDGRVLRPDFALIDDPQSTEAARSPLQVRQIIDMIDGDVAGMGAPDRTLPMQIAGTVIERGDVMDHYLTHAEWRALRVAQIVTWPNDMALWDRWNAARLAGEGEDDKGAAGLAFYEEHHEALTAGLTVSWSERYDKARGQPDALYSAMHAYYTMGRRAFMAERQQAPEAASTSQYTLTPEIILSRNSGYARLCAPAGSVLTCGIDINYIGFNWSVVAADTASGARRVVAHGIWPERGGLIPKGVTDQQACALIRRGMGQFAVQLAGLRVNCGGDVRPVHAAGWDASNGKWQDAICAAIKEARLPFVQWAIKAFGARLYRPSRRDLRQGKGWHVSEFPRVGRVLVINADYWRETMQRGFLAEPTEPGALSLYDPPIGREHAQLADEVCGEALEEHVVTDAHEYYTWTRLRGLPNDRPDSLVYACALTGLEGIGEDKMQARSTKARVVIGRPSQRRAR